MPRLCLTLFALSLLTAPLAAQAPVRTPPARLGFAPGRLERIGPVVQAAIDSGRAVGAVVLVARHGTVAYARAFGWADREAQRPMELGTLFRIASQTKAVTSVAVMMLVEDGLLRLGDPVAKFLPGFATARVASASDTGLVLTPVRRAITIRDLLTHTAGISYGTDSLVRDAYAAEGLGPQAGYGWYFADKAEPICASMERLSRLPIVAQPGARFVYGYNTDILGCVVEKVSGQSLANFFAARIFGPLGMRNTWFYPPAAAAGRLATLYAASDGGLVRAPEGARGQGSYLEGPRASYSGGAGLVSSAGDYARFLQMLANGGSLDGARILGPRTVGLMIADHADTLFSRNGLGFGLGFELLEEPGRAGQYGNPGRFGWGGAYATNYWVDPKDGLVVVFMTQLLPAGPARPGRPAADAGVPGGGARALGVEPAGVGHHLAGLDVPLEQPQVHRPAER
jgi:CubicO group peptidase (beta-lactamase class C family)